MRLQKYMAACGIASRRRCDVMIAAGRVGVNGIIIQRLGTTIMPGSDKITLDGIPVLPPAAGLVYYMLHKPRGYLTTARDERGRQTVFDLLKGIAGRVVPVGRLDLDSEGLLLLTNDGELAHKLMHPRFRIEKEYEVWVDGKVTESALQQLRDGVNISKARTQPAVVRLAACTGAPPARKHDRSAPPTACETHLYITITEGRKRQVRLMCEAVGHPVRRLRRIREGCLRLGNLPSGQFRPLTSREIDALSAEIAGSMSK
ncbi:MAG: pseudouridine synthase [bacterium]|nr:pseudouridine synthase [Candidatus Sumerlaeota bacterium]